MSRWTQAYHAAFLVPILRRNTISISSCYCPDSPSVIASICPLWNGQCPALIDTQQRTQTLQGSSPDQISDVPEHFKFPETIHCCPSCCPVLYIALYIFKDFSEDTITMEDWYSVQVMPVLIEVHHFPDQSKILLSNRKCSFLPHLYCKWYAFFSLPLD